MTEVADRYISLGGRLPNYGRKEVLEDLETLSTFLAWAEEDGAFYAGYTAKEAFQAMTRILDVDAVELRKVVME